MDRPTFTAASLHYISHYLFLAGFVPEIPDEPPSQIL